MVRLHFKLSTAGRVVLAVEAPLSLAELLPLAAAQAGIGIGGTMVIRRGRLIRQDELVHDGDELDIYPALSGG